MLINFFNKLEINFNYDIIENTQASFTISIKEIFLELPVSKFLINFIMRFNKFRLYKSFTLS